jgi:protein phosphatase
VLVPLALLAVVLFGGWSWSQDQYYVAMDGDAVAIYRGVQVDLPLVALSHVEEPTDLSLGDLTSYNRGLVEDGITADSITGARKVVANLARDKEKPDCPTATPQTSPKASPKASSKGSRSAKASPRASAQPSPKASAQASSTASSKASASPSAGPSASASPGGGPTPAECASGGPSATAGPSGGST